jgi:hypothetical protein
MGPFAGWSPKGHEVQPLPLSEFLFKKSYSSNAGVNSLHYSHQVLGGLCGRLWVGLFQSHGSGLDSKNLELSVSSGDVVLKSLSLKKSALKDLELPIRVKEGKVVATMPFIR